MEALNKQLLRQQLLVRRKQTDPPELKRLSDRITQRFLEGFCNQSLRAVHLYLSSTKLREVDTASLIRILKAHYAETKIFVPLSGNSPRAARITAATALRQKLLGIPEPVRPTAADSSQEYDIIVVPTLAFDDQGNRLGYGGGYYDKLLALHPNARKVGVCLEAYKFDILPAESHDIPLDAVVTEKTTHRF